MPFETGDPLLRTWITGPYWVSDELPVTLFDPSPAIRAAPIQALIRALRIFSPSSAETTGATVNEI